MRSWFRASVHDVKVVLLSKFDPTAGSLLVELWEEEARSGDSATGSGGGDLEPVLRQAVAITRGADDGADLSDDDSFHVLGGELVLDFRLLFLRVPGPRDRDVVLTVSDLRRCAYLAWKYAYA